MADSKHRDQLGERDLTIQTRLEYALYVLAVKHPELFQEAERWVPAMLASDQDAARRVKRLIEMETKVHPNV